MRRIEFPAPAERLSLNKKLHWAKRSELVAHWRQAAFVAGRNSGFRDIGPSVVTVRFTVAQHRRRDPHNFVATVKPIVDGLVDAKFWPDDTPDWVAVTDPIFDVVVGGAWYGTVIVELREMG
jgi:hypothetical protein